MRYLLLLVSFNVYSFELLDATRFTGHSNLGMPVTVVYENQILGGFDNYGKPMDEAVVRANLVNYVSESRIILDVESWRILTNQRLDVNARIHAEYFYRLLQIVKEELPDVSVGFYGWPVNPRYALKADYLINDHIEANRLLSPTMQLSDALYPSFYVDHDEPGHQAYTHSAHLYEAKKFLKPVYPFVWHRGPGVIFNEEVLPVHLINQFCVFLRENASGAVWWSISTESWDPNNTWYHWAYPCLI